MKTKQILSILVAVVALVFASTGWASNPIVTENALTGNPSSEWDIVGFGDATIQGFATDMSVNQGDTVHFKIDTDAAAYQIKIYRLGYYGGDGARNVANILPTATLPQVQPDPITDPSTGLLDCGNWAESASWAVPSDAVSGVYIAKLIRTDTLGASHIVFIVRDDAGASDLVFQTPDQTWQAYNTYGGDSLYTGSGPGEGLSGGGRAYKVSYNRPILDRTDGALQTSYTWLFGAPYPMIRWLEANGYNVSYISGLDTARHGDLLTQHKAFLSVGHDEYWSAQQRTNVETALAAGLNLAFLSGNEMFWKTRWEPSIDGSATPNRTLVCYKETHAGAKIDPSPLWTGTWRDPRFSPPSDGGRPENALSGTLFAVNGYTPIDSIKVPFAYSGHRLWRNTSVAALTSGQTAVFPAGTLGFEWDESPVNGFQPAGQMLLSSNTVGGLQILKDYGSVYQTAEATHRLSLYRSASGALVFGAGTVQWSWGLDATHDNSIGSPVSLDMQQATVNLFADMGVQPGSPQAGLTPATESTDHTAPTSTILSPIAGGSFPAGSPVTISGTAADTGGGVVWGVEVSTDGGTTWRPALGRESWSFTWVPAISGPVTLKSRAVDDSGNLEVPSAGVSGSVPDQITIWTGPVSPTPGDDAASYEVGVKFRSDVDGYITGIRFYQTVGNGGTHIGNLWTTAGVNLASATFAEETGSGWQQVNFDTPVPITAGVTYVASYFDPRGNYAYSLNYFTTAVDNPPLHALADSSGDHNGVYVASSTTAFPNLGNSSAVNYWVDPVFVETIGPDTTDPTVTGVSPVGGATGVRLNTAVTVTFSEAMNAGTITGGGITLKAGVTPVAANVTYNAGTRTATLTPTSSLSLSTVYTVTVAGTITDLAGNPLVSYAPFSFTTTDQASYNIWPGPVSPMAGTDPGSYELGVRFRSDIDGYVTGIRFYQTAGNGGTHVGNLWNLAGVNLGSATFSGETGSGWQQVNFASPVAISAGVTYVASYFDPQGHYAFNNPDFTTGVDNPPLHALASGAGGNGVLVATSVSAYPANVSGSAANYWVDVVFVESIGPDVTPPTVTGKSPADLATGVSVNTAVTVTFSEAMDSTKFTGTTFSLNPTTPATVTYDAGTKTATLAPTGPLANSTVYTVTVLGDAAGVTDVAGNPLTGNTVWSFTTEAPDVTPPTVTGVSPVGGATGVRLNTAVTVTFSEAMNAGTITGGGITLKAGVTPVAANVTYNAGTRTATLTPTSSLSLSTVYTVTVAGTITDLAGNPLVSYAPFSFTTTDQASYNIWPGPVSPMAGTDPGSYELGVRFRSDIDGYVTGIRFYQTAGNGGTHVGNLWNLAGVNLGSATFSGETGSGWQQVNFASPVAISAGVTYVASYFDPQGHYAFNNPDFTTGVDNPPLHALASGAGGNGVLVATSVSAYPANVSGSAANYWVDVVFVESIGPDVTPPTVTGKSPADLATGVSVNTAVTVTFSEAMDSTKFTGTTFSLNPTTPATVTYDAGTKTATLAPTGPLANSTVYTVTVLGDAAGVTDVAGNPLTGNTVWSFTTEAPDVTPPTVTGVSPVGGATGVRLNTAVTVTFSEAMNAGTITGGGITLKAGVTPVAANVTYNAGTRTATLTPTSSLSLSTVYTVTVAGTITDLAGNPLVSYAPFSFTTTDQASYSIWTGPVSPMAGTDPGSYELGVKFRSDIDGYVTGIRFYQTAGNGGTHVGNLWNLAGVNLGSATFSGEAGSGWQQVNFASPVAISAGVTYVASYFDPQGHYAVDSPYFTAAVDNPPLHALADGTDGGNGVYVITGTSAYPNQSGSGKANYWVDVVFVESIGPDVTPPTVTGKSPADLATGVSVNTAVTVTFSEAMDSTKFTGTTFSLNPTTPATVTYDAGTKTATLAPTGPLANSTVYTVTVLGDAAGVTDVAGNPLTGNTVWSFTTEAPDVTPPTVTGVSPVGGATGVRLNTAVTVTFSEAMNAGTITGGGITLKAGVTPVAANVTYNAGTRTATLTPTSSLSLSTVYTVTVAGTITDLAGNPLVSYAPFSFTTTDQASYNIWPGPVSPMAGTDPGSYELGVRFRSDIDGYVTGIRFYQTAGNGGTHVGNLWNLAGVNLGSATFSGETGSGWQQVNFASPVAISAGVTYVASYFDPQGHYAFNNPDFTTGVDNPPLHALASGAGGNGVLVATSVSAYPANVSGSAANYWVDVVFVESIGPDVTPPTVTGKSPADLATGVSVNTAVTVTFSEAMDSTKFTGTTFSLNPTTPATVTYDAGTKTATLAPTGPLANSTVYTVTVLGDAAGVTDVAGNPLTGNTVWSFTTEPVGTTSPLTVTGITAADKGYDGNTSATIDTAGATLVGVSGGDDVTLVTSGATGTFDNRNAGPAKTVQVAGLTIIGADIAKYTLIQPAVPNVAITKRGVTVVAVTDSKAYDGTTSSVGIPTITPPLAGGDSATVLSQAFQTKDVGVGNKVIIPALTINDGNGGANYVVTPQNFTTGTISALGITGSFAADNKPYDGNTTAEVTSGSRALSGVLPVDTGNVSLTGGTASFADAAAGNGKTVTLTGASLSGSAKDNYTLSSVGTALANITPLGVTVVSGLSANNKPFDGTTTATISSNNVVLSGVLPADTGNVRLMTNGYVANFADAAVGNGKTVTVSGLTLGGSAALNYALNQPILMADITAGGLTLTVTGITAAGKGYDGNTSATINTAGATLVGVSGGDDVTLVTSGATGTFDNRNAGPAKTVQVAGLTISGADIAKYTLIQPAVPNVAITKRGVTVVAVTDSKAYDGTTSSVGIPTITPPLAGGDSATVLSQAFQTKDVGVGNKVIIPALTINDGNGGANYVVTPQNFTTGTISTLGVTVVSGLSANNKPFDGTTTATISSNNVVLSGVLPVDTGNVSLMTNGYVANFADAAVGNGKTVTVSGMTLTGSAALNYALNQPVLMADITARALTVVDTYSSPGSNVNVVVNLAAQGDEHSLGFSLAFDPVALSYSGFTQGSSITPGSTFNVDVSGVGSGEMGVQVSLPTGTTFPIGSQQVVVISFQVSSAISSGSGSVSLPINFTDQPVVRQVATITPGSLPASYVDGKVTVYTGYEGDANGSGGVSAADYTLVGLVVAGLNTITDPGQFMRVDCAPRSTRGNGIISASDWTQTGRYVVGLDAPEPIGGLGQPGGAPALAMAGSFPPVQLSGRSGDVSAQGASDRILRLVGTDAEVGATVQLPVELVASGDENTLSFSTSFDPAYLEFLSAASGNGLPPGAQVILNTNNHVEGQVGVLIGAAPGTAFTSGAHQVLVMTMRVKSAGNGTFGIAFSDAPVKREFVSEDAAVLPGDYLNAVIHVGGLQNVLKLDISQISSGGTRLTMSGTPGHSYQILVSNSLTDWTVLTTVTASSTGLVEAWDSEAKKHSTRFYRAVAQ